jgi:predicted enzyme involved in methoxymalonyl-ACP biosynthesis
MSCRAFSRRIEHHTLDSFFRQTNAAQIEFAFQATERNAPLREFFRSIGVRNDGTGAYRLSRSEFLSQCGVLPHEVLALTQ